MKFFHYCPKVFQRLGVLEGAYKTHVSSCKTLTVLWENDHKSDVYEIQQPVIFLRPNLQQLRLSLLLTVS